MTFYITHSVLSIAASFAYHGVALNDIAAIAGSVLNG